MERISFLVFLLAITACTSKIQEASIDYFGQAATLKSETQKIQQDFEEDFKNLVQERNSILVQGQALTESELMYIEKINKVMTDKESLNRYLEEIAKSENAYEPNGKELLYLNEQANQLVKKVQKKIGEVRRYYKE